MEPARDEGLAFFGASPLCNRLARWPPAARMMELRWVECLEVAAPFSLGRSSSSTLRVPSSDSSRGLEEGVFWTPSRVLFATFA